MPELNTNQTGRRDFIKAAVMIMSGLIGTLMGIPSVAYLVSPTKQDQVRHDAIIPLGPLEDYPIGIPTRFDFTRTNVNGWERTSINYGLYVLRNNINEARVFSDICTHLGCRVTWHADIRHYVSPCHDGHFDSTGKVVSGPPPLGLGQLR